MHFHPNEVARLTIQNGLLPQGRTKYACNQQHSYMFISPWLYLRLSFHHMSPAIYFTSTIIKGKVIYHIFIIIQMFYAWWSFMIKEQSSLTNGKADIYLAFRMVILSEIIKQPSANPKKRAGYFEVMPSQNPSSLQETNHKHYDCNNEKNMNETSHGIRGDHSKKPEDYQYDNNGFQHFTPSLSLFIYHFTSISPVTAR